MNIKEFNTIRRAVFDAAIQIPEIADKLCATDTVLIYDLTQLPDKHIILPLNYKSQLNDNTLRAHGFNPDRVIVKVVMSLNRKTKCATW